MLVRAVIALALIGDAQSRIPTDPEKSEIISAARLGAAAHKRFVDARRKLEMLPRDSAEWRDDARKAVHADRERRRHFDAAIVLTLSAYGIKPDVEAGVIANGPFSKHRLTARWRPYFEPETLVSRRASDGESDHYLYFNPKTISSEILGKTVLSLFDRAPSLRSSKEGIPGPWPTFFIMNPFISRG